MLHSGATTQNLLVNVLFGSGRPCQDFFRLEPQAYLAGCAVVVLCQIKEERKSPLTRVPLRAIRSVDYVAANINSIVSTDGSRSGLQRLGDANQLTPDHNNEIESYILTTAMF